MNKKILISGLVMLCLVALGVYAGSIEDLDHIDCTKQIWFGTDYCVQGVATTINDNNVNIDADTLEGYSANDLMSDTSGLESDVDTIKTEIESNRDKWSQDNTGGGISRTELAEYLGIPSLFDRPINGKFKTFLSELYNFFVPRTEFNKEMYRINAKLDLLAHHLNYKFNDLEVEMQTARLEAMETGKMVSIHNDYQFDCYPDGMCLQVR